MNLPNWNDLADDALAADGVDGMLQANEQSFEIEVALLNVSCIKEWKNCTANTWING